MNSLDKSPSCRAYVCESLSVCMSGGRTMEWLALQTQASECICTVHSLRNRSRIPPACIADMSKSLKLNGASPYATMREEKRGFSRGVVHAGDTACN